MAGSFSLALAPRFAFAQAKVPRIGYLLTVPLAEKPSPERVAFLEGLRDLGYIDGQSITVHYRAAAGNLELLPDLAAELVDLNVDVIVVSGFQAVQATKQATKTVPIVMIAAVDPVATGLVASLARPGGNVTRDRRDRRERVASPNSNGASGRCVCELWASVYRPIAQLHPAKSADDSGASDYPSFPIASLRRG